MDSLKLSRLLGLALSALLPATGAFAAGPHFVHHDEQADHEEDAHYSDKGAHPSKAERLGVVLQSRVLLDKAGTGDFEVTTGKLDSTVTPPGNIDKLEVVALRPGPAPTTKRDHGDDDREMFEKEYRHLRAGGYAHYQYKGLVRGQTLLVKAHVSGFGNASSKSHENESEHESVKVELADVVKYRPDFAVQKLDYSTTALPNTPVQISGVVVERMGDLGAHADCALLVDGAQVDQAKGIWIDASGMVSCHFVHTFKAVGVHTVTVTAQNVLPGDFDLSNNSLSGEISIKNPATLFYTASAYDSTSTSTFSTDYYFTAASTTPDQHSGSSYTSEFQGRSFSGHVPLAVSLPLKKISYSDSSDGAALTSLSFTDTSADSTGPSTDPAYTTESVISRYDAASGGWLFLHRYENTTTGAGSTTLDLYWMAGTVTYHSDGFCSSARGFNCYGADYTYNNTGTYASGVAVKLGAGYAADVVLDDGTSFSAHPKMSLTPMTQAYNAPAYCFPLNFGGPTPGKMCNQSTSNLFAKNGYDALVP